MIKTNYQTPLIIGVIAGVLGFLPWMVVGYFNCDDILTYDQVEYANNHSGLSVEEGYNKCNIMISQMESFTLLIPLIGFAFVFNQSFQLINDRWVWQRNNTKETKGNREKI